MNDKNQVRSSTAEYLTFIATNGGDSNSVEMRYEGELISSELIVSAYLYLVENRVRRKIPMTMNYRRKNSLENLITIIVWIFLNTTYRS